MGLWGPPYQKGTAGALNRIIWRERCRGTGRCGRARRLTGYAVRTGQVPAHDAVTGRPDAETLLRYIDVLPEPLTAAELRVLKLLPTSGYLQMAATLCVSRNTVKTHLRSVYQKLGATSRAGAIERAIDLGLL